MRNKSVYVGIAVGGLLLLTHAFGSGPSFHPDATLKGTSLAGWHMLGQADWKMQNGELVGTPKAAGGGWLVLDRSYQDVGFYGDYLLSGDSKTGLLVRMEKTPEGFKGVYVSLSGDDAQSSYAVKLDAQGQELSREKLRTGGGQMRIAPPPPDPNAPARGRGGAGAAGGAGRAGAVGAPGAPGAAGAARGGGRAATPAPTDLPVTSPKGGLRAADQWNNIEISIEANIVRPFLNDAPGTGRYGENAGGVAEDDAGKYGPVAIYVGGSGEVHYKNIAYKDFNIRLHPPEKIGAGFRKQQLNEFYYSWGAAAGDFNHDGILDVVSGPYIYFGPDYTKSKEIYLAHTFNVSDQYSDNAWMQYAADFTGDGWDDVLNCNLGGGGGTGGCWLYVNPKGESRRWDSYHVLPDFSCEIAVLKDVDGDGKLELVYSGGGHVRYAKPDPANPTATWVPHDVSDRGYSTAHGIGVGDINGDGRMDITNGEGWWEQPPAGDQGLWKYHPEAFGRYGRNLFGGSVMGIYDVNGDGLADVVTSLNAHGWGLAWFEQKRDKSGNISFVQHMVMDDFSTRNAGNVTFSELHGSAVADMDGDGKPDFVVGKRYWAHRDDLLDPDPYGEAVLYYYKSVLNPKAPGGAELVPVLIHNRSGAGSDVLPVDLNKDGAMDLVTATRYGTFIFWGKPKAGAAKPAAAAAPPAKK
jgi:hypothetical protein